MKRQIYLYLGIALIALRWGAKKLMRELGLRLKVLGRRLESWGNDDGARWSIPLFHKCYLADAEFSTTQGVFRGPMYAAYLNGKELCFKLNWVAKEQYPFGWEDNGGARDLIVTGFGAPQRLENGDVWFTYDGGHAILYLSKSSERLKFRGNESTPRIYTYF